MKRATMGRTLATLLALGVGMGVAACSDDPLPGPEEPEDVDFDASLGVDLSLMEEIESGLFVRILEEGDLSLPAGQGTIATIDVTIWLPDATVVLGPTELEITAGSTAPPPGLGRGIVGMFPGERRQIVASSEWGWGASGTDDVPPHSVIVMEVELNSVTIP